MEAAMNKPKASLSQRTGRRRFCHERGSTIIAWSQFHRDEQAP
jgi:hypothetical protein